MAKRKRVAYESPAEKKRRLAAKKERRAAAPPAVPHQAASSDEPVTDHQAASSDGPVTDHQAIPTSEIANPLSHFREHPEVFRPREQCNLLKLPVEYHCKILLNLLLQPDGDKGRFGDWWAPYRARIHGGGIFERWEQRRRFEQRTRYYRNLWNQQNGVPPSMRSYFEVSPFARRVWEEHARILIRDAMQALADDLGLGPGKRIEKVVATDKPPEKVDCMNGLLEWDLNGPLGLKRTLDRYLDRLPAQRDMADLLYLQQLQYNRIMIARDRAGRPEVTEDPISPSQPLNRLPGRNVHARILFHLFDYGRDYRGNLRTAAGAPVDAAQILPRVLHNYFRANPTGQAMWNKHALSIVEECFKVVRRGLEMSWQAHDRPIPSAHAALADGIRAERRLRIRRWQRDGEYLSIWRTHLRAEQTAQGNDIKENDDAEEKDALAKLLRDPSRPASPA
jgi:hypothetical protein